MTRIRIRLSAIMGEKRIKPYQLAEMTGLSRSTINKYYYENVVSIRLDYIVMMCEALGCRVSDMLVAEVIDGGPSAIEEYRIEQDYRRKARARRNQ